MRILIAEDNDVTLTLLEATLSSAGFEVVTACDGHEAMRKILDQDIRMVISDWEMPHMDGLELCLALRHHDVDHYIYFILLTSHNTAQERVRGLTAGADDFIAKPCNPAELVARVRVGERILSLETRHVAIFMVARLAESRDPETGAHLERVRNYCRVLTQQLAAHERFAEAIDGEFIRLIYQTSPLHDIGKVGIPDAVLLKPGRLDDEEFAVMKTHAQLGADTLEAALRMFPEVNFLRIARDIAATHHERYDGKGYPAGLAGDEIPLCGRIVALADVYDALTSKRIYKDAMPHDLAQAIIIKESGCQFDPDIVQAFLQVEDKFQHIRRRFEENAPSAPAQAADATVTTPHPGKASSVRASAG